MKQKNGFTVVELITVIIIIGIVAMVAVPAFSQYLGRSKKSVYADLEASMISAAKNYMIEHSSLTPNFGENNFGVKLQTLVDRNYLKTIADPEKSKQDCHLDSYVRIKRSNIEEGFNIALDYDVCLVCSRYKSSTCLSSRPSDLR